MSANGKGQSWPVTPAKVRRAARIIGRAAGPCRIVLFGSSVRAMKSARDADFLVITRRRVTHPMKESVRLRRAVRRIPMAMDILVIDEEQLSELAETPGLIYREALRSGRVIHEAA